MLRTCFVIAAVCCFQIHLARAQEGQIESVLAKLNEKAEGFPHEKVYLHLDKPYYTVGDDIWFKAYVTIGVYNNLSGLSKILNVDLIDPEDRIVQSVRLPLLAGVTMGDFNLADSLNEGNYRIRAYTNWMRNFDNDVFFDRTLPIGNARTDSILTQSTFSFNNSPEHHVNTEITFSKLRGGPLADMPVTYQVVMEGRNLSRGKETTDEGGKIAFEFVNKQPFNLKTGTVELTLSTADKKTIQKKIPLKTTSATNSIQFFPESGHMIAGHLAKLAFKALKPEGLGIGATGYVEDNAGTRIAEFESAHAGMGAFNFIPQQGIRYTAKTTFADGSTAEQDLPLVQASGYALAVNNEMEKQLFVQAIASTDLVKGQEITLILQRNGTVFYASKSKLSKNEAIFAIPREAIPAGIVQITLFSPDMKPLAERAIFQMNEASVLPLGITTDKEAYGTKQKVSVRLSAGLETDTNRIATLSAAVIDMVKVPVDDSTREGNILASLLLSPDIKGYVETPEYYFENTDIAKRRQLDNLLLTQGWSRIDWQDLEAGRQPTVAHQPEQDLRISGMVTKRGGKTPVPNATVTVLSTGNFGAAVDTVTGEDGRFSFDRLLFYDDTKFVVQARDDKGRKTVDIQLDESPRQQVTRNRNTPDATINVNQSISTYLKNTQQQFSEMEKYGLKEKTILLEEVKVTGTSGRKNVRHSSNLNGPGNADQVITAEELMMGCATLEQCLQGRLMGVMFRNGVPYSTRSMNQPMQVVLDGMFMEGDALSMITPFDVETVEVLRNVNNTAIYGSRGSGGVLVITTKRGDSASLSRNLYTPGIVTHSPQGYYEVREFYVPNYDSPVDSLAGMKDFRTTIHWAPNIVTDQNGEAAMAFYTADSPGTYRIVIEGLDVYGRLGRAVGYITVK